MSIRLQILLGICALTFLIATVWYIRRKGLDLYRSILWFLGAVVLFLMAIFPENVERLSRICGIETPSNFVFLILIAFLLLASVSLSASLSRHHRRIRHLVQYEALLENKVDALEERVQRLEEERQKRNGRIAK